MLLLALMAPGSVEAELGRLQAGIFAEHGLVSAQALPPLIPIAFLPDAYPQGMLFKLDKAVRAGWRMSVTGPAWVEGFLYMGVASGGTWAGLRERALALRGAERQPLFPPAEGFFMGCGDASPEQRPLIHPAAPAISFTSGAIAILSISSPRGINEWWRELYWETVEERPLRGRREA
ncbi:MAG: hypothetical protein ABSF77_01830 [Spirochaetia bacterium]